MQHLKRLQATDVKYPQLALLPLARLMPVAYVVFITH
jgi:hypothetical protein